MKKQGKVMALIEKGVKFADEHQREIMLGGAIAGTVVTAVLSWKAGIKAESILEKQRVKMEGLKPIEEASEEVYKEERKKVTVETVKELAPIVAPPVLAGTATIISVIAGYKVASTQIATLSALYSMTEKARTDYMEKAKEVVGKKKADEIEEKVAKEKVTDNPAGPRNTIINTGRGNVRFLDPVSGRYFYSKPEDVKRAVNAVNNETNVDGYFTELNEFYNELGIPPIDIGKMVGFRAGNLIDIDHIFKVILDDNDDVVYVLQYEVKPGNGMFYE